MPTPGTVVNVTTASGANNRPTSTGSFFAIGQSQRGPVGVATSVTSLAQYVALFGTRQFNGVTQTLYDAIDIFFQEGGAQAYISRVSGTSVVIANHTLVDRAGSPLNTLKIPRPSARARGATRSPWPSPTGRSRTPSSSPS